MKKILLSLLLFIVNYTYSQIAYQDALTIKNSLITTGTGSLKFKSDNASISKVSSILRNYLNAKDKNDSSITETAVLTLYAKNPFIGTQIARILGGASASPSGITSAFSKVGNLDVTNFADGLAKFLIKRGKEELNIAFFQRMKDFLDSTVEAKTLFPNTADFLVNVASYRYAEFLQAMREAFYKDISNLIINMNLLIDLPKYQNLLKALPEIRLAVRSAKIISELSQSGKTSIHPANLIHELGLLKEWGEMNVNLESAWHVLDRISESVRTNGPDTNEAWIKFSDFNKNVLSDKITLDIFLGLLYQQMDGITFRNSSKDEISVQKFMNDNRDNVLMIADLVENFIMLANDVQQSIQDIKLKKESGLSNDDYYTYINKAINIVEYGFKVADVIKPGISADRYIVMARNANNLYKNIYTKSYNAAVMNAYLIINEILTKSTDALKEKELLFAAQPNIDTLEAKAFSAVYPALKSAQSEKDITEKTKIVERLLRYGNLIASIVKAENSEEAAAAIEAAVLPAGSSSIKKNTKWNVSLNAYIGGAFGRNINRTDKIDGNNSKVGITAPVGIAVSKGLGNFKNGTSLGALSVYGTLIDVGAIAGYRLNNDSTALDSKITLNDIFTPGAYIVYGVGLPFKWMSYVPLSIGYGWQYGSKLYYKKDDGTLDISGSSRWRSNWFVAIDIPLVNFININYKKK